MQKFVRFGRRLPIPSTHEIRHELRSFCVAEDVREENAAGEGLKAGATWAEIYAHRASAAS